MPLQIFHKLNSVYPDMSVVLPSFTIGCEDMIAIGLELPMFKVE